MADASERRRVHWGSLAIGIFISVACLAFILHRVDLDQVRLAFLRFEWRYFALGVLFLACGYAVRVLRWTRMLNAVGAQVPFRQCAAPFLGSIAINNVLPLRLGDVVRALVFPASLGVSRSSSTSSLIMERLVDLMTLLVWLAASLALSVQLAVPGWLKDTAVALAIAGSASLAAVFALSGAIARRLNASRRPLIQAVSVLMHGFDAMTRPRVLATLFGLSLLVWLGEAGLFYSLLLGFGLVATPAAAMIIMSIATLATLVPSSPGYVGPFHLAAFAGISLLGGTSEQAASFAVLSHLGLWVPTTFAGAIAIASAPQMFRGLRVARTQQSLEEQV
jgi:uncharacterized protein (TIRG00374 family)